MSSESGSQALLGQVLGGAYLIRDQLDEGGMGLVYEAEHIRLKRPVAVKVMASHLAEDPNALARFTREAEIISQLHHPHVVQVLDFNTTEEGRPYLVMELLTGRPLDRVMADHGTLGVGPALLVAIQVASALSAAHQAGVVHRDLKPANIFLLDAGDQLFVKLLDFGISKKAEAETRAKGPKLTGEFDILGTPEYMAPEQALGKTADVDARGDQYALSIILYEMLTGRVPFTADDVLDLLQRVIRDIPVPPSTLRPEVPKQIDEVILKALSKNPERRYKDITSFALALEDAANRAHVEGAIRASMLPRARSSGPRVPILEAEDKGPPSPDLPFADELPSFIHSGQNVGRNSRQPEERSSVPEAHPDTQKSEGVGPFVPPNPAPRITTSTPAPARPQPQMAASTTGRSLFPDEAGSGTQRTSWYAKDPVQSVRSLIDRARQEAGLDNLELAINCAESALDLAHETANDEVKELIRKNSRLFRRIFEQRLGGLSNTLLVSKSAGTATGLSPQQAFLLSRLEGGLRIEEALDLSPLSREITLAHLISLVRLGHISLGA